MMYAKEEGMPVDREALAQRVRGAVGEVVMKQGKAGIDIVNDGEMSKPSYATYVKDRLGGFGGREQHSCYQDLVDFPNWRGGCSAIPAGRAGRRRAATARSRARARRRRRDIANLAALSGTGSARAGS